MVLGCFLRAANHSVLEQISDHAFRLVLLFCFLRMWSTVEHPILYSLLSWSCDQSVTCLAYATTAFDQLVLACFLNTWALAIAQNRVYLVQYTCVLCLCEIVSCCVVARAPSDIKDSPRYATFVFHFMLHIYYLYSCTVFIFDLWWNFTGQLPTQRLV